MIEISLGLIMGLTFGIEHESGEEEDFFDWVVPIHLGIFRIIIIKHKA